MFVPNKKIAILEQRQNIFKLLVSFLVCLQSFIFLLCFFLTSINILFVINFVQENKKKTCVQ